MPQEARDIAVRFVSARRAGAALSAFPGALPSTLADGYAVQEEAIDLWGDVVAGWKIGLTPVTMRDELGTDRVAGPIFAHSVMLAEAGTPVTFPVFEGGFAAVEAEVVFRIGRDAPAGKTMWSIDEAAALVASAHIGVETAGSPMSMINEIGPVAVASDFGNNFGVVVGAVIGDWRQRLDSLFARTLIDGQMVGEGRPSVLPGGPLEGLRFLAAHLAERKRPLRAGQYVSTGALTGVHDIRAGQEAVIEFVDCGSIRCRAVPFRRL